MNAILSRVLLASTAVVCAHAGSTQAAVKLLVQITVDQLRGDMLPRFRDRFGSSGFRYLMDGGVYFANAHYQHATTFTAVGHATLYTGGHTAHHGIVGNEWIDSTTGRLVSCVGDPDYPLIGSDPAAQNGRSPRRLTSSTIGDELVMSSVGEAKSFSVSFKDRAAIIPAGHLGKAFWYSPSTGKFVSSTYYYDEYPSWADLWNRKGVAEAYRHEPWELLRGSGDYLFRNQDDRSFEKSYKKLGRTFPHPLDNVKGTEFYASLAFTPYADAVTVSFAKDLVRGEELGQDDTTDVLALSFSSTDRIGHAFGPNSLEYEDNLLRLDDLLANLFRFIDDYVGLGNTLIVLAADHGGAPAPEHAENLGFEAGRLDPAEIIASSNSALKQRFGIEEDLVLAFTNPGLYLDLQMLGELGLQVSAVETAIRDALMGMKGIALAITRSDLLRGQIDDSPTTRRVSRAFHSKRSGNVIIVQDQFWHLYPDPNKYTATHGSPFSYDTFVPILWRGTGVEPRTVYRSVAPADIAPSVAAFLGIKPPSGSVGNLLHEVLKGE